MHSILQECGGDYFSFVKPKYKSKNVAKLAAFCNVIHSIIFGPKNQILKQNTILKFSGSGWELGQNI